MGVLKELKELVTEMGGNAVNARTVSQAIDKIPVSGGGSDTIVLHMSTDEDHYGYLDMTAGEIKEAFEAEKTLVMFIQDVDSAERPVIKRFVATILLDDPGDGETLTFRLTMSTIDTDGGDPFLRGLNFYAYSYDEYPIVD